MWIRVYFANVAFLLRWIYRIKDLQVWVNPSDFPRSAHNKDVVSVESVCADTLQPRPASLLPTLG